jgi:hypothetical protein
MISLGICDPTHFLVVVYSWDCVPLSSLVLNDEFVSK